MAEEKKYVRAFIKEKTFDNGGTILNASIHMDVLKENENADGWVKIVIAEGREVSEKGATHYAYIDTFVPEKKDDVTEKTEKEIKELVGEDLPF